MTVDCLERVIFPKNKVFKIAQRCLDENSDLRRFERGQVILLNQIENLPFSVRLSEFGTSLGHGRSFLLFTASCFSRINNERWKILK
jgi:hypothetical protein